MPKEAAYLWQMYIDVRRGTEGDLTYSDIQAYRDLTGDPISPWEVDTLLKIDLERKQSD